MVQIPRMPGAKCDHGGGHRSPSEPVALGRRSPRLPQRKGPGAWRTGAKLDPSEANAVEGASIYLAQSGQRLRDQHPRGQRQFLGIRSHLRGERQFLGIRSHPRGQRQSLGIRSHASLGIRNRASPNVGRNRLRRSSEVRSRRCEVRSRNSHSYEVRSNRSCWSPSPNRTNRRPRPVCFQGQGEVRPPPRRQQVSVCASDHSYPTFSSLRRCQLRGSVTLGGNPEREGQGSLVWK